MAPRSDSDLFDFQYDPGRYMPNENPAGVTRQFTPFRVRSLTNQAAASTAHTAGDHTDKIIANTTLTDAYSYIEVDATAGNVVITMPVGTNKRVGKYTVRIVRIDGSANTVTIQRNATGSINGQNSFTLGAAVGAVFKWADIMLVDNNGQDSLGLWRAFGNF